MISLFQSMSLWILELEMFPIFDFAHDYLAAVDVRKSLGPSFASESPFNAVVSWALTIACTFAGSLIANFLIGENILAALSNIQLLMLATVVWLAVSYSPYDIVYRIGETFPVKLSLNILKEVYRARKVSIAIFQTGQFYFGPWLLFVILIGVIRGNGAGVVKQFWQIIQKTLSPQRKITVETSFSTKACLLASIIFLIKFKTEYIPISYELVHFGIVIFFIVGKISTLFSHLSFNKKVQNRIHNETDKVQKSVPKKLAKKKSN